MLQVSDQKPGIGGELCTEKNTNFLSQDGDGASQWNPCLSNKTVGKTGPENSWIMVGL